MAMKRTTVDGRVVNERTANMLARAEARLGLNLHVVQGSYNAGGVSASAGTHDRGGAIDISPVSGRNDDIVRTLREVGFAAWHRMPNQGPWNEHIHCIAIGDPELSWGAASQVKSYYAGLNGLANHARDDGPRLNPIPTWPVRRKPVVSLVVTNQLKADKPAPRKSVQVLQESLSRKLRRTVVVDGVAGPQTRDAYRDWQRQNGFQADGLVRRDELKAAVAGYGYVV